MKSYMTIFINETEWIDAGRNEAIVDIRLDTVFNISRKTINIKVHRFWAPLCCDNNIMAIVWCN